jgi:hypothetical protein
MQNNVLLDSILNSKLLIKRLINAGRKARAPKVMFTDFAELVSNFCIMFILL